MQLVQEIQEKLQKDSVSVLKMSNDTGISAYKIYKWLAGKGNPKAEDAATIKKWLSGNLEKVPNSNNGKEGHLDTLLTGAHVTLQDYINELRNDKAVLYSLANSILDQIKLDTKTALAYQMAWVEHEAERQANGDEQLKRELIHKMNKLVRSYLLGHIAMSSESEMDKKSKA